MLRVDVGIVSNRCGTTTNRKIKLLYAGSKHGFDRFFDAANAFVPDEQHRYTIEHRFTVRCAGEDDNDDKSEAQTIDTWSKLCYAIDQFFGFPLTAYNKTVVAASHYQPEHAVRLLLTDDQYHCLLNILFNMQRASDDVYREPIVLYAHRKQVVDGDTATMMNNTSGGTLPPPPSPSLMAPTSDVVFARKLVELRKLKETLDSSISESS